MIVDASIWVSSLVAQDQHHQVSRRWPVEQVSRGETLVVPTLALPEVAGAIARRTGSTQMGREAAREMLRTPGLRLVALDDDLSVEAADLAADARLRGRERSVRGGRPRPEAPSLHLGSGPGGARKSLRPDPASVSRDRGYQAGARRP